jgi:hypothetical protein
MACLGRRWIIPSAVFHGAATMVKIYPILLVPYVVRYLSVERRTTTVWIGAFAVTAVAFIVPPLLLSDWTATWLPYRFQLMRAPEHGWTFYDYVLPWSLAANDWVGTLFRHGSLLLVMLILLWSRPVDLADVICRGAIVLILFVGLAVFYSPQWVIWFTPLLIPLAGRQRLLLVLAVVLDLATYVTFPLTWDYWYGTPMVGAMIYVRFALFAGLIGVLGWMTWRVHRSPRAQLAVLHGR